MRNLIGIVALSLLAAVAGCAADDTESKKTTSTDSDNPFADIEQNLSMTGGTCTLDTTGAIATVTMPTTKVLILTKRVVDSQITTNGVACGTSSKIKQIIVTGTAAASDTVIVDYSNGLFATGAAAAATTGIMLDLKGTGSGADKIGIKGTSGADSVVSSNATQVNSDVYYSFRVNADAFPDVVFNKASSGMGVVPDPAYIVYLGEGNDSYTGGLNKPITIYGGNGNDTFNQTAAPTINETMYGGAGTDTITYALRTASVYIDVGDLTGTVPTGDDGGGTNATTSTEFDGIASDIEVITGGTSADTIVADAAGSTINGGDGTDSLTGGAANDTINGGAGNDTIDGAAANDTINGDADNDSLVGGAGNDVISGGTGDDKFNEGSAASGADVFNGGAGTDLIDYSARTIKVFVTMDGAAADDGEDSSALTAGAEEGDSVKGDIENIYGSAYADTITGNALNNQITGNALNDTLDGAGGDDIFYMLAAADGNDTITGGAGTDLLDYSLRVANLTIVLDGTTGSGLAAENDMLNADIENVWGGTANDSITGTPSSNELVGNQGNDTLLGMAGDDVLDGAGTYGTLEADVLTGGTGDGDVCYGSSVAASITTCEF